MSNWNIQHLVKTYSNDDCNSISKCLYSAARCLADPLNLRQTALSELKAAARIAEKAHHEGTTAAYIKDEIAAIEVHVERIRAASEAFADANELRKAQEILDRLGLS